jgi:8-oxo-dGTP pyrophosphatase MutT (NUDIX family)
MMKQAGQKDFFQGGEGRLVPGEAAVALIMFDDGRYLLQLRDQKPGIFYPGHWGLFGGATEPGESAVATLRRELQEELGLAVPEAQHVTDFTFTFGRLGAITRHFFEVLLPTSALAGLRLAEGSEMRAFLPSEILNLPRVVPYDSFAIWLHASGLLRQ